MKRTTAISIVAAFLVSGCIDTKDIGLESESESETTAGSSPTEGNGESSEGAEGTIGSHTDTSEPDSDGDTSEGAEGTIGSHTDTSEPDSDGDTSEGAEGTIGSHTDTSEPETDGDTTDGDTDTIGSHTDTSEPETDGDTTDGVSEDAELCADTAGEWDEGSCGHYMCGQEPECAAVIPGCDCGPGHNFVDGQGCVADDACASAAFACGDSLCAGNSEFCDVVEPGIKGPNSYACESLPAACLDDVSCECLDEAGIIEISSTCTIAEGGGVVVTTAAP